MAIIPMKKVSCYCMKQDRPAVIDKLQKMGVMQIVPSVCEKLKAINNQDNIFECNNNLDHIRFSLGVIKEYDPSKKSFLAAAPAITPSDFFELKNKKDIIEEVYKQTKKIDEKIKEMKSNTNKLLNLKSTLEPFATLDIPIEHIHNTSTTNVFIGFIANENLPKLDEAILEYKDLVWYDSYLPKPDYTPILLVAYNSVAKEVAEVLRSLGFSEAKLTKLEGTAAENISKIEDELQATENQKEEIKKEVLPLIEHKQTLLALEDFYVCELNKNVVQETLGHTQDVCLIEGYIKKYDEEAFSKGVAEVTEHFYVECEDPADDDENLPTAIENSAIVTPFESVTELYSTPSARTVDSNAIMTPFYFLFFGMMLSDAVYGIILAVIGFIVLKVKKPDGMFKKILSVIAICGISTLIWGMLFGSWMGFSLTPIMFNPLESPMEMLILCISLGIVHLLCGLFMGAYINIKKRKDVVAAICDQGFWILILISIPFFVFNLNVAIVMIVIGAVGLVLSQGRHEKKIVKKITKGIASLYDVTGYVSDILSYCRVFGLALSTAVIATVFNQLAFMFSDPTSSLNMGVIGLVITVIVMLIGHVFNLGINTLGSYVHTMRLQYIEFFSKFFEGNGKPFKPLNIKVKNMRFENKTK